MELLSSLETQYLVDSLLQSPTADTLAAVWNTGLHTESPVVAQHCITLLSRWGSQALSNTLAFFWEDTQ